ncbi:hypothetical protein K488DRAFT_60517, partial [Vararia minispora EC-137]
PADSRHQTTSAPPMPVDPSSSSGRQKAPRRDQDGYRIESTYAREIEMKRSRGEISCAECRRLKIKCDKQIPCQSCQRRGCAALCPNGALATGQGTRFVIAATEHLHKRIARMSDRIRQLEDALTVLHSAHSHDPHPLLQDTMLLAEHERLEERAAESDDGEGPADTLSSFGTMSISDQGSSRFFGATGGTENLLLVRFDDDSVHSPKSNSTRSSKSPTLSSELTRFSFAFPFTPMGTPKEVQAMVTNYLPTYEVACAICETYLTNAAWLFRSTDREQLLGEMLPVLYKLKPAPPVPAPADVDYAGPHALALFFSVLSVGCIVDIGLPTARAEADGEHYNQLAMAALVLQPVLEHPSLITIQALHVASIYNAMSGSEVSAGESSMETTWSLVALAAHLAHTVHRDSARWEPNPRMVQRRRMLFWDLFVADSWHALSNGRPPSLSRPYIDCQYPQDTEMKLDAAGNAEPGFGSWGFRFAFECVAEVAAKTLTPTAPRYSEILDLDRRIREFAIPADAIAMLRGNAADVRDIPLSASMTLCVLAHTREVILMFMHRSFFAQALIEDPVNPLRTPYAPSFLASVRCATTILRVVREQFTVHPSICSRFWAMWTYAFSAAIVFGVIVTRGPRSHLAETGMAELEQACELFASAGKYNRRAAKAHAILLRLRDKAHRILTTARGPGSDVSDGASWDVKQEDVDDELAIFAARTKVLRPGAGGSGSNSLAPSPPSAHTRAEHVAQLPHAFAGWQQPPPADHSPTYAQQLPPFESHMRHLPQTLPPFTEPAAVSYAYGSRQAPPLLRIPSNGHGHQAQYLSPVQPDPDAIHLYPPTYAPMSARHAHGEHAYAEYAAPPQELVQLGLAPTGRLQENWNSFMHHTGILG